MTNKIQRFIQVRIVNRIRQYGLLAAVVQLAKASIRNIYMENRDLVFIISDFTGYIFHDPCISNLSLDRIEKALVAGELDLEQAKLLSGFIGAGCLGLCAEVEGALAGYAWVQLEGAYTFGRTGHMSIPPRHALFKNLFVSPVYRGMGLGQKLNAARLALVPSEYTPVVFIIPDNRYAIRNWENYGFRKVIAIKRWKWGQNGKWKMRLSRLVDIPESTPILHALENSSDV